ncbi:MAG: acyl-CoA dehydrogenase [Alphaproteobacteria bacterium]|nr:acyl-CoA dehydrogenase [Alphaproteobacteria bacterium]
MIARKSGWMNEELQIFSGSVRKFFEREALPHNERWNAEGKIDRDFWNKAGEAGLLCVTIPEEYGGMGGDFRHEAVIVQQEQWTHFSGWGNGVHSGICAPYILAYGTEEQKRRWLPKLATGEMVAAIAMTEPGTGSDLQAVRTTAKRDGASLVINGQKTFITNGQHADLIIVVCKTGDVSGGAKNISLVVVEANEVTGYRRGRNLEKVGLHAQDTSELFFDDVRVPADNVLGGDEGRGFYQLMQQLPRERLIIALGSVARIIPLIGAAAQGREQYPTPHNQT